STMPVPGDRPNWTWSGARRTGWAVGRRRTMGDMLRPCHSLRDHRGAIHRWRTREGGSVRTPTRPRQALAAAQALVALPRIRLRLVPHTGHLPLAMRRPL